MIKLEVQGMDKIQKEIKKLGLSFPKVADKALKSATDKTKENVKRKTSTMFRQKPISGLVVRNNKKVIYRVGFNKKWWFIKFFESGTKRHTIKGKPWLAIRGKRGNVYLVKKVRHPGTRKRPFMLQEIVKRGKVQKENIIGKEMWRQIKALR